MMLRIPFVLFLNLIETIGFAFLWSFHAIVTAFRRNRRYVKLEFHGSLPFARPRRRWRPRVGSFLELREALRELERDKSVSGVVLHSNALAAGAAHAAELVDALDHVRSQGKHIVAQSDLALGGDYLLATSADDILVTPAARLYTFGPRFEQYFLREAFEKAGISAQFVHIGAYKAAANRFVRREMSIGQREMLSALRGGFKRRIAERIAGRRRLTPAAVDKLYSEAPLDARAARRLGFVDDEAFADDVVRWIASEEPHAHFSDAQADETDLLDLESWRSSTAPKWRWRPIRRPKRIAMIDLSGMIVAPGMNLPGTAATIDPAEVIPALRSLAGNRGIAGVIVHIDSPGGSALASDLIWKAIRDLAAKKPVVAYLANVAASGGYYIAVAADRIVCRPETITGSIGVITGKLSGKGVAARLGVGIEAIDEHEADAFPSMFEPLGDTVKQNLVEDTRSFYRRFLQRVGQARGIGKERLHRYARGRVYLGQEALERGLVDELSGFDGAVAAVVRLVQERGEMRLPREPELVFVSHHKQSLKDALRRAALSGDATAGVDKVFEAAAPLMLLQRDPVLALMPMSVRF